MKFITQFFVAVGFLSRLPLPDELFKKRSDTKVADYKLEDYKLASAVWAFPLVGFLIGAAVAGLLFGLEFAGVPFSLQCVAALGFGLIVTGALHEDGLADFADGLGVTDQNRILEVMREPQIGSFGVLALLFSLLWRGVAFYEFGNVAELAVVLMVVHAGARGLIAPLLLLPVASQTGLAYGAGRAGYLPVVAALCFTALIFLMLLPFQVALMGVFIGAIFVGGVALLAMKRLRGMTGDVYGAAEQAAEMSLLLILVTML